jgi:hypothetical protein
MSIQDATNHYVIFAANKHLANRVNAWLSLNVDWFKPLIGSWEGKQENSWIVNADEFDKVRFLLEGEVCVMGLGTANSRNNRPARLVYLESNVSESVGHFVEVSKEVALARPGYTQDFCREDDKTISHYWSCFQLDKFGDIVPD